MRKTHFAREFRELTPQQVRQRADELVELQRSAYQVEADLIGDTRIPQLTESAQELIDADLNWIICLADHRIIGAVAYSRLDEHTLDIERLIVSPDHHRQGIGRELIHHLPPGAKVVSTGRENRPARSLYENLGFTHDSDYEVLPDLWLSRYCWARTASPPD